MTVTIPFDPPGIDAAGKGSVLFVPAIADLDAPTVAEMNAALTNLSCVLYGWNPNGTQGTVSRFRYCYASAVESLGRATYSADPIEYDYDPQSVDDATGEYAHYAVLAPGTKGFIVDRRGLDAKAPYAAGQIVDIYPVELGIQNRQPITDAEGEKLRVQQAVGIVGQPVFDVAIAS